MPELGFKGEATWDLAVGRCRPISEEACTCKQMMHPPGLDGGFHRLRLPESRDISLTTLFPMPLSCIYASCTKSAKTEIP